MNPALAAATEPIADDDASLARSVVAAIAPHSRC